MSVNKLPAIGETVILGGTINPTMVVSVYKESRELANGKRAYNVKVVSGDVYEVVQDGLEWRAIK